MVLLLWFLKTNDVRLVHFGAGSDSRGDYERVVPF
jgi:hypothetical protein